MTATDKLMAVLSQLPSSIQWNDSECDKMVDVFTDRCMNSSICKEKNWKRMMAKKHIG